MANTSEPAFCPEEPARGPSRKHVSGDVPALHIAGLLSPVADHVFNRIRAQQSHVEGRRKIKTMHGQGLLSTITQGQRCDGVSLGEELPKVFKGFFPGFVSFSLTKLSEEPLRF